MAITIVRTNCEMLRDSCSPEMNAPWKISWPGGLTANNSAATDVIQGQRHSDRLFGNEGLLVGSLVINGVAVVVYLRTLLRLAGTAAAVLGVTLTLHNWPWELALLASILTGVTIGLTIGAFAALWMLASAWLPFLRRAPERVWSMVQIGVRSRSPALAW